MSKKMLNREWLPLATAGRIAGLTPIQVRYLVKQKLVESREIPGSKPEVLVADVIRISEGSRRKPSQQEEIQ